MSWQEKRYELLLTLRSMLEEMYGEKIPESIVRMLDRTALIATEEEFNRFLSFQTECFKDAFEKSARFEAV